MEDKKSPIEAEIEKAVNKNKRKFKIGGKWMICALCKKEICWGDPSFEVVDFETREDAGVVCTECAEGLEREENYDDR